MKQNQIEKIAERRIQTFRKRLEDFLEGHLRPDSISANEAASFSLERCEALGLNRENDIADYAYRVAVLGLDWERRAPYDSYAIILSDRGIPADCRFTEMRQAEIRDEFKPFQQVRADNSPESLFQNELQR